MPTEHKTVFISYRRKPAAFTARAIFQDLREHGYDVFMDVENIDAGRFGTIIDNQIKARVHFLIVLTTGTVGRFDEPKDWLRHEIEFAMEHGRNIVPLLINDFKFDRRTKKYLTGKLADLPNFNGLRVPHEFFDEAMDKLRARFLQEPTSATVSAAPAEEQPEVERRIEEVAAQPVPTIEQLSAEEYFNRGLAKGESDDHDGAIADFSKAIRFNPHYAEAYNNRGVARQAKADYDGAIADYAEAIRLKLEYYDAFYNRGLGLDQSDSERAIVYCNRGVARYHKGDFDDAIVDYTEALRLNPEYAEACNNRGEAYFARHQFDNALEDFQKANRLRPADKMPLSGLAITHYALGQKAEAKRRWRTLLAQDQRYHDADWVGKELLWSQPLIDAVRQLIAEL